VFGGTTANVFKVTPSGIRTTIYARNVNSGVVMDSAGNLYGTTSTGGTAKLGSVYKLTLK
jgi:uncharacterized repeat protein (TIGR03803 family)